jgi:HlyD family secretion protein
MQLRQLEVYNARSALWDALESLEMAAETEGSAPSLEVELKRLQVANAQAALDGALERLEMATMVAPYAGTITSVNVEAGQEVTAKQVVIELVDPSVVEVSAILDEIDVSQVKPGQSVSIYLDALPDLGLYGEVSSISTVAKAQSGVVTYPVTIKVNVPSGIQLREGMSATASIVVEEATNVLLIPNQAISGSFDNPVVNVMVNEEVYERSVELGLSDGLWTEVLTGLEATDVVVVQVTSTGTSTPSFGGMMMPGMGGFSRPR